jgi:hypothetical protein
LWCLAFCSLCLKTPSVVQLNTIPDLKILEGSETCINCLLRFIMYCFLCFLYNIAVLYSYLLLRYAYYFSIFVCLKFWAVLDIYMKYWSLCVIFLVVLNKTMNEYINQPYKIQFMTSVELPHVPAPRCLPWEFFRTQECKPSTLI